MEQSNQEIVDDSLFKESFPQENGSPQAMENKTLIDHSREGKNCGAFLRELRTKKGITHEQIYEELKIKYDLLEAIENWQVEKLPETIYVVAIVRRLCTFYQVETPELESLLQTLRYEMKVDMPDDLSKSIKGRDYNEENTKKLNRILIVAGMILLLFIAMISCIIVLVVINLKGDASKIDQTPPNEQLIRLQPKVKLKITELQF